MSFSLPLIHRWWTLAVLALALVLLGAGLAAIFVPLQNLALTGVAAHDAGAAAAAVNAATQIGGSIGLSVFTVDGCAQG